MQNDIGNKSKATNMENLRRKFMTLGASERSPPSDKTYKQHSSPTRSTNSPKKKKDSLELSFAQALTKSKPTASKFSPKSPKQQTFDLPFLLSNKDQIAESEVREHGDTAIKSTKSDDTADIPGNYTRNSFPQSGNNSTVFKSIKQYMNTMRSPRKSQGNMQEFHLDPSLRNTRGRSLLQLEEIVQDDNEGTFKVNFDNESVTQDFEDFARKNSATSTTKDFGQDENYLTAGNIELTMDESEAMILQNSPQPAPRLKINRIDNAPKPAPRKITINKSPTNFTENKDTRLEEKLCTCEIESSSDLQDDLSAKSPRSRKGTGFFKSTKRDSKVLQEGLLDVLQDKAGLRNEEIQTEEEMLEKQKRIEERKLRREEEKLQQEENAQIAKMIAEIEERNKKNSVPNEIELEVQGAFVVCDKAPNEDKVQSKSPRKALREVKRRISTMRRTRSPSTQQESVENSPVRPHSDVLGNGPSNRRKSSGYKNTLSKVKRAMSMKVTTSANRRQAVPRFGEDFGGKSDESWHVDDGAVLNLDTRRTRKSRNQSVTPTKTPKRSQSRKYSKTMRSRIAGGDIDEENWNPVLRKTKERHSKRNRVSKTVGFRQSHLREDWDKITDFGGMKDRRAQSTTVETENHLYEEIAESTVRALSWDTAFEPQTPDIAEPGSCEYQFIDDVFAEIRMEAEKCEVSDIDSDFSDAEDPVYANSNQQNIVMDDEEQAPLSYSSTAMTTVLIEEKESVPGSDAEDAVSILTVRENDEIYDQVTEENEPPQPSGDRETDTAKSATVQDYVEPTDVDVTPVAIQETKQWTKSREIMNKIFNKPIASDTDSDEYMVMQRNDLLIATNVVVDKSPNDGEAFIGKKKEDSGFDAKEEPVPMAQSDQVESSEKTPTRLAGFLNKLKFSPKSSSKSSPKSSEKKKKKGDSKSSTPKLSPKEAKAKSKKNKKSKKKDSDFSSGQFLEVPIETSMNPSLADFSCSDDSLSVSETALSPKYDSANDDTSAVVEHEALVHNSPKTENEITESKSAEFKPPTQDFLTQLGIALKKKSKSPSRVDDESDGLHRVRNLEIKGDRITSDIVIYDIPNSPAVECIPHIHTDTPIPSPMHFNTAAGERRQTLELGQKVMRNNLLRQSQSSRTESLSNDVTQNEEMFIYDTPATDDQFRIVVISVESNSETLQRDSGLVSSDDGDVIYDVTPDDVFISQTGSDENTTPTVQSLSTTTSTVTQERSGATKVTDNVIENSNQLACDDVYDEPSKDIETLGNEYHRQVAEYDIYDEPPPIETHSNFTKKTSNEKTIPVLCTSQNDGEDIYDQPPKDVAVVTGTLKSNTEESSDIYDLPPTEDNAFSEETGVTYDNQSGKKQGIVNPEEIGAVYESLPEDNEESPAEISHNDAIYDEPGEFSPQSNYNNRIITQDAGSRSKLSSELSMSPIKFTSASLRFIGGGSMSPMSPSMMYRKVEKRVKSPNVVKDSGMLECDADYADIEDEADAEDDDYVDVSLISSHSGATPRRPPAVFSFPDYDVLKRSPTSVEKNDFVDYMMILEISHGQCALSTPYISVNRTPGHSIDQSGDIYATDCHGDCMDIYSYKGKHKSSINVPGNPRGLASYTSRHVLCASSSSGDICVVDSVKGATLRKLGRAAKLQNPRCVIMHPCNQTFVTTDIRLLRKWRILMFDIRTGNAECAIDSTQDTKVGWPEFVTFKHGSDTETYVSDSEGHVVMSYDFRNSREPTITIGRRGHEDGEFISPCGVAHVPGGQITLNSAPNGSLLVADWGNNRISSFDATTGSFQCHVIKEEDLQNPFDLKVDTSGAVYLTESGTNNIKVFHPI